MKRLKSVWIFLLGIALLSSCGGIKEEIYINEDGSGTYTSSMDFLDFATAISKTMVLAFAGDEAENINMDSLEMAIQEGVWKDFPNELDSIIDLAEHLPEEIMSDPENAKYLSNTQMFMKGSKAEQNLVFGITFNFNDPNEINEYSALFEKVNKLDEDNELDKLGMGLGSMMKMSSDETKYVYKNGAFQRIVKRKPPKKDKSDNKESDAKFEEFLNDWNVTTTIHFPKKIKSVKGKNLHRQDDKSVTFKYGLIEYFEGKKTGSFKVTMEN